MKTIMLEVPGDTPVEFAIVQIDSEFARMVVDLMNQVTQLRIDIHTSIYSIVLWSWVDMYLSGEYQIETGRDYAVIAESAEYGSPARIDACTMEVTADCVQWSAYLKHDDREIRTCTIPRKEFEEGC